MVQQRRGKGGPPFVTPKHRFYAPAVYPQKKATVRGEVLKLVESPAHSALLAEVLLEDGSIMHYLAAESLKVGAIVCMGKDAPLSIGNVLPLGNIPEGIPVFNIELAPGDGGKVSRTSGTASYVVGKDEETGMVSLRFSSKRVKALLPLCMATIGVNSGGGRLEKPFKKAGSHYYERKARNKYYPIVRGTAKSAYDHPHGGRSFGKSSCVSRDAPPGQKAGHIASSRTGRRRGRIKTGTGE